MFTNGEKPNNKNPTKWFSGHYSRNSIIITTSCYKQGISKPHRVNPYPNTQSDLFCNNSSPFWCMAPKYVTNGCADPSTQLQNTNLKRLLAAKFFSATTRWRSRRCLVTKPYGANTQQLLQKRDELGQELCLRSQFAWTEFAQCLCNLCTVWRLLKKSFYISRVKRKEGP